MVERRRQGTQSAFESSNIGRKDRQSDEADRRCAQAQGGNSRYWPRPRSVAFRRRSQPSLDQRFSVMAQRRRVHLRSSPALPAENVALPSRGGRPLTVDQSRPTPFQPAQGNVQEPPICDSPNHKVMPSPANGPPTDLAPNRAQRSMLRPMLAPDPRARAAALSHPLSRSADRGGASQPEFERDRL